MHGLEEVVVDIEDYSQQHHIELPVRTVETG
jgi:hypothetical protein